MKLKLIVSLAVLLCGTFMVTQSQAANKCCEHEPNTPVPKCCNGGKGSSGGPCCIALHHH
jgi:hypothetical protein